MREIVLKKANRGFLDLFWEVTNPEVDKRDKAIDNLLKHLAVRRNVGFFSFADLSGC